MAGQHHSIRRQFLHVELNGTEEDGFVLQRRLSELCRDRLSPALERALDRFAAPGGHLRFQRLEVDAGTLSLERMDEELADTVVLGLERSIREQLSRAEGSAARENVRLVTELENLEDAFIHFLKTGGLPWSLRLPAGTTLEQALLESWLASAYRGGNRDPVGAVGDSLADVVADPAARYRLASQFSPSFLQALLGRFPASARWKDGESSDGSTGEAAGSAAREVLTRILRELPSHQVRPGEPIGVPGKAMPEGTDAGRKISTEAEGGGVYVNNAGLVVLHPFFVQFFQALGLARGSELLEPGRALCLLHYMATGQTTAPEYELMLPKVLCGLPLGTPAASDVGLTTAELEEADALLGSVIRHWDALRSASPDGLRGAFLLRSGRLSMRDDGEWFLQVEPDTADILLDRLPWGFSMIHLPWMPRMLRVEWGR
jgi:hypothetical protein